MARDRMQGSPPLVGNGLHASMKCQAQLEKVSAEQLVQSLRRDSLQALLGGLVEGKVPIRVDAILIQSIACARTRA